MNGKEAACTVEPVIKDPHDSTPSITQQGFKAEFFNFGKAESGNVDYFNCGIVQRPDGLFLIVRRSKHKKSLRIGVNDVVAFKLDHKLVPAIGYPIIQERRYPDEHFEDPRAVYHDGKTYVSSCDFIIVNGNWTGAHQVVSACGMDWVGRQRFDPIFGNNGETIGTNTGHEKNWLWFFHEGEPHLVYQATPHRVIRFNRSFVMQAEHKTVAPWITWPYGEIRGGSPPVRVGDEYWTFFHSSLKTNNHYWRRYYMGAYAFEAKPPFTIKAVTPKPLLIGSKDDPWSPQKPLVVFPCGALLRGDKWLVTMGVNDLKCAWAEIPHEQLLRRCFRPRLAP